MFGKVETMNSLKCQAFVTPRFNRGIAMNLRNLVPWSRKPVPVKKNDEQSLYTLHRDMNALFNELLRGFESPAPLIYSEEAFGDYCPYIDLHETEKEVVLSAELPGMDEKDVMVSMAKDTLTISGEKRSEKEEDIKGHYKLERCYGMFRRTVVLPCDVLSDSAKATFKNGVLTVTLPKNLEAMKASTTIPITKE